MVKKVHFEIKDKDYLGRIGKLTIDGKKIETPYLFPVVNPVKQEIPVEELKNEFNIPAFITNAYILYKKFGDIDDIHKFFKFDGIIMTDSGAFQWMQYGNIKASQEEIVLFEEKIRSDIKVPLDKPCLASDYDEVKRSVDITLKNLEEFLKIKKEHGLSSGWVFPIQGKYYRDLIEKCLEFGVKNKDEFDIFAIGSVVPEMDKYIYDKLVLNVIYSKYFAPIEKPIHAFGVGHPIVIPLLVFMGCDLFDSASYILFAKDYRYMTEFGTKQLDELDYLPCNCPICRKYGTAEELKKLKKEDPNLAIKEIAKHNLYVIFRVIDLTKQYIREGRLFQLVSIIVRSHPELLNSFKLLLKIKEFRELAKKLDPIRKRSGYFYLQGDSEEDPHLERAFERVKERVGRLTSSFSYVYPFGQTVGKEWKWEEIKIDEKEIVKDIIEYQFGKDSSKYLLSGEEIKIKRTSKGRINKIYVDGVLVATIRTRDGYIALTLFGAKKLLPYIKEKKKYYVMVKNSEVDKIKGSILHFMIKEFDENILPREEVIIVDEDWNLIGVGEACLSGYEMKFFRRGEFIRVRHKLV